MEKIYPVPESLKKTSWINADTYQELYERSVNDPEGFWNEQAKIIDWFKPFTKVKNTCFDVKNFSLEWFSDGVLNVSYNCLDRHLETRADKIALIWEGDSPEECRKMTYRELHSEVCRFANGLKTLGAQKGDRITIYMPMSIEGIVAMLACTRIGAIHSVVFGGFSPESLANRIMDCQSRILITADGGCRGGRLFQFKENCDTALRHEGLSSIEHVIVVRHAGEPVNMLGERDLWYHDLIENASNVCAPEPMGAEDPLFVLYTSGSTASPKGLVHTTGGYLVYAALTHKYIFDCHEDDVYWCTADIGWITGHSYVVYGPLANGTTSVVFEGIPSWPDHSRLWDIVDRHSVSIFYTAPTVIRSLMRYGDDPVRATSRKSLRLLGSVGEPINSEAWDWYYNCVGEGRCPIMDTWWQTETGGILISPLPGATDLKPASATRPFFGIKPGIVDVGGKLLEGENEGNLVITDSWPGQARTILNNHDRFLEGYFKPCPGYYLTGDGARRDSDGYYWITGRVDDVINVSGHRIGTAEVESALGQHPLVSESAVVAFHHDIKGQGIYAYVTLVEGAAPSDELAHQLKNKVREFIGPVATPDIIQWAPMLPKTRSGKIMRRILRKIAASEHKHIGDTSTLADPDVVEQLIRGFHAHKTI